MHLIDLSHTIEPDMPTFGSAPEWKPTIRPYWTHAESAQTGRYVDCTCEITEVRFLTSIGTYMDSPFHFNPNGIAIDQIPLEQLVLPAVVIDCTDVTGGSPEARTGIGADRLRGIDVRGKAVLFHTAWDWYWGQPYYFEYPFLTEDLAIALRDGGAKMAGVDFLNVDDNRNPRRPVHVTLLHAGVLIVENLTHLGDLPQAGAIFHAAPIKVAGAAAFPVRAYGVV
jgi:kynurenine formamidase